MQLTQTVHAGVNKETYALYILVAFDSAKLHSNILRKLCSRN